MDFFVFVVCLLSAAFLFRVLVVGPVRRRRMRRHLLQMPDVRFDVVDCNLFGSHCLGISKRQQVIGIVTRDGGLLSHRLIEMEAVAEVDLLEHHGRWPPVDGVWIALQLTLGGAAPKERVIVPFLDAIQFSPKVYPLALTDAGQWRDRLRLALEQFHTEVMEYAAQAGRDETDAIGPPATAFPARAQTPPNPRVPTVQPGR